MPTRDEQMDDVEPPPNINEMRRKVHESRNAWPWPKIKKAIDAAVYLYPMPVARVLIEEIQMWADVGYIMGGRDTMKLMEHLLKEKAKKDADDTPPAA